MVDAFLFSLSFWLAHLLRDHPMAVNWFTYPLQPFSDYSWLLLFIFPVTPLFLEKSGFYNRPLLASFWQTAWPLAKTCAAVTIAAIIVQFFLREQLARSVYLFLPALSFALVIAKEELVKRFVAAQVSQASLRRRLIIAGTAGEPEKLRDYLHQNSREGFDVVEEIELDESFVSDLPKLLHKYSANAVVLCARHTVFGLVERAIQTCELEGVEVWLMADFFKTEISQTSLDDFYGKPMLVFR